MNKEVAVWNEALRWHCVTDEIDEHVLIPEHLVCVGSSEVNMPVVVVEIGTPANAKIQFRMSSQIIQRLVKDARSKVGIVSANN